jgi:hypothetical protein
MATKKKLINPEKSIFKTPDVIDGLTGVLKRSTQTKDMERLKHNY